jgi:hypothetical protein
MSSTLSQAEINQRLVELRNVKHLYENQKKRIKVQEKLIKTQRKHITTLTTLVSTQETMMSNMKLQIEELRIMVFGKKRKPTDNDTPPPQGRSPRSRNSYRRPIPKDSEVTDRQDHPIDTCTNCHGQLEKKRNRVFFEEDIPLPTKKTVLQHTVEQGYCTTCKKWVTAVPLPSSTVILGPLVQKYICYLSVMCRLSYSQIQELLADTYCFDVSQGEIAKVLNRTSTTHRPEYEQQKIRIRGKPGVGLDETGYSITSEGGSSYAWVMVDTETGEAVYIIGVSRGGGNVTDLLGEHYQGFTITDDYGAYKTLPRHQLCFAHLIRKFRDLAQSDELTENHAYYVKQYTTVAKIFTDLEKNRDESQRDQYTKRLTNLATVTSQDCSKLVRIKTTLLSNISKYLTCLGNPLIPLTNNISERSLRHLVLKRKISFGAWTHRGAENLAILLSVLMSRKQRNPGRWFGEWVRV